MMKLFILMGLLAGCVFSQAYDDPSRVVVVYRTNQSDGDGNGQSDSKDLAEYYQAKRGIPAENLLGVTTPDPIMYHPNYTLHGFFTNLVIPLRNKLTALGETNINFIVLCKGIPYRMVSKSSSTASYPVGHHIAAIWAIGNDSASSKIGSIGSNPMYESSPEVGSDKNIAFDHNTFKINDGSTMYLVTYLNGVSFQDSKELVDKALYAEKYLYPDSTGANGYYSPIGYVDTRYGYYSPDSMKNFYPKGYGSYGNADMDMIQGVRHITEAGFKCRWEHTGSVIGQTSALYHDGSSALTAPNAIFYGGWYNFMQYYTNTWTWMPGAFACDLNSNSLSQVPSIYCFGGSAISEGATAVSGVIDEPYLTGHTQPEKFLYYITHGANYGEIAYHSDPMFGWKTWNIGDPLYRPLAVGKTPVKDDVPPPAPVIVETVPGGDYSCRNFSISINTDGMDPDLVLVKLEYGITTAYDSIVDYSRFYRMQHTLSLTGLTTGITYHYRVTLKDPMGNETATEDRTFTTATTSAESQAAPTLASLAAFPNPFNPSVQIQCLVYAVNGISRICLDVFNAQGKKIRTLEDNRVQNGRFISRWDGMNEIGRPVPSGVYFCRLTYTADGKCFERKITLTFIK
ncbi:MAG: TIGR03790 family protein [Fibrobacterota bacterium]